MLLTRNSGCKDKGFVLIDKDFRFFFIIIGMFGVFMHLLKPICKISKSRLGFIQEYFLGYRNRMANSAQIPIVNG
ncbi:hypothetical protein F3P51_09255 [Bacteroides fragilis]|uniref:Transmembrane protein n=1 Tax=Bacteroides fragilis TaxID=817 RepID=A0A642KQ94_BACFG|nr:hypothetical protein F2Z40_10060 [Bacteroides fragilis]KAA5091551.1 hypothetical protein F2Z45_10465 [Bacteroides fragilis]KAA5101921.1 hypothetical protein F2Z46_09470 [Bacteroides fragilis]KAA5104484.1 hypothetical protein F2Z51_12650 [Bacteroides fragilis]KAA5118732.1 hypothetical protein F2Z52_10370 [Bacteroides fragilis]